MGVKHTPLPTLPNNPGYEVSKTAYSNDHTIDNDTITLANIVNSPSASILLGRGSLSGAGDYEPISLGASFTMSGTTLNVTGGVGADPLFLSYGLSITATNPEVIGGAGFWITNWVNTTWSDITGLNPNFANLDNVANNFRVWHADATYATPTFAKTTQLPWSTEFQANGAGQRFLSSNLLYAYGMGDCFFETTRGEYGGGVLPGDEGFGYRSVGSLTQPALLTLDTINSVTRATGNTTITQAVTADKNPQTVTVASTVGINPGDWYQVNRIAPSPIFNSEAIQIISVGAGTITAMFRTTQAINATLTPCLVLNLNVYSTLGQLRVLVNLSGASYSTGTITGKSGAALTGVGMAWTNNMVGGDAINVGAISLDNDTYSGSPHNGTGASGPVRSWYEVYNINPTQLNVVSFSIAADVSYRSSRWAPPSNYIIRPAVRILRNVGNGTIVCETTSTVWTAGDSIEQVFCPYPDCIGDSRQIGVVTAGATLRSLMSITNGGPVPFETGLSIFGAIGDKTYGFGVGIQVDGGDVGINFQHSTTADLQFQVTTGSVGKMSWLDGIHNPYIEHNADNSLTVGYGGGTSAASFGGLYCTYLGFITTNLAGAEFRTSWVGASGNPNVNAFPYFRLASTPTTFAAAATSIDMKLSTPSIANAGTGLEFTVFNAGVLSATTWSMGTNAFLQCMPETLTLSNGANGIKDINKSFQRITGPTGAFSVAGFWNSGAQSTAGGTVLNGTVLYLYNSTAQAMTIKNLANGGQFWDILTLTGGDVVFTGPSFATLIYNQTDSLWILMTTYH